MELPAPDLANPTPDRRSADEWVDQTLSEVAVAVSDRGGHERFDVVCLSQASRDNTAAHAGTLDISLPYGQFSFHSSQAKY